MSTVKLAFVAGISGIIVLGGNIALHRSNSSAPGNGAPSPSASSATAAAMCSAANLPSGSIVTVAGSGLRGRAGDGGPATAAQVGQPAGLAFDAEGNLYISTTGFNLVRRVAPDGTISAMSWKLKASAPGVGGPDGAASFGYPLGLAFDATGALYVADPGDNRVLKVDLSGAVNNKVAGNWEPGSAGDGGPATSAQVEPASIAVGPRGDLYLDAGNRYRTVDATGTIRPFAGTGVTGYSGDGGSATEATFGDGAVGIAVRSAGNVYLGDPGNHRIRKVDTSGKILTVAGSGQAGYSGDNGPATQAQLGDVSALALDDAGNLYAADTANAVVRRIDSSGVITTVAGNGTSGFSGDCGPAVSAMLGEPLGIAVHSGALYIADLPNDRVRMVVP